MDPMSLSPHSTIVNFLERQGGASNIDFLVSRLGRGSDEIKGYLYNLQEDGVVAWQGNTVSLTHPTPRRPGFRFR